MQRILLILIIIAMVIPQPSAENQLNVLEKRFAEANLKDKYAIVDSCLNSTDSSSFDLVVNLLISDKYKQYFETPWIYRVLQTRTADKISAKKDSRFFGCLYKYYYGNQRKRKLSRQKEFSLDEYLGPYPKVRPLFPLDVGFAKTVDSAGNIWVIFNKPEFGCYDDLWLAKKSPGQDYWEGPWFTGFVFSIQPEDSRCLLKYQDDSLNFISSDNSTVIKFCPDDIIRDSDDDGLYDVEEIRLMTDPAARDTDGDGIIDGEDMNPLASGKKNLSPADYAKLAVFRREGHGGMTFNIYFIATDSIDNLEYYTDAKNAIIINCDPRRRARLNQNCDGYSFIGRGARRIKFDIENLSGNALEIEISKVYEIQRYRVEKVDGVWLITESLWTADVSRSGDWW